MIFYWSTCALRILQPHPYGCARITTAQINNLEIVDSEGEWIRLNVSYQLK